MARHTTAWLLITTLFIGWIGASRAQDAPASLIGESAAAKLTTSDLVASQRKQADVERSARLLDPSAPLEERLAVFREVEALAQSGNRKDMYVVGSLYRIGGQLPACPVARDLDKARLYLSNAATHGEILAMAKMAEMEVSAHHPIEAMTWTQIYGHYAELQPEPYRPSEGYLAELVDRASPGVPKSQMQDVVDHLNAFIAAYDASVRDGIGKDDLTPSADMTPRFIPKRSIAFRNGEAIPPAGFVDYYVAFDANGDAVKVLTLDAVPDIKLDGRMHSILSGYKVAPSTQGVPIRYAFIPVMFDDGKFRLAPKSGKSTAP